MITTKHGTLHHRQQSCHPKVSPSPLKYNQWPLVNLIVNLYYMKSCYYQPCFNLLLTIMKVTSHVSMNHFTTNHFKRSSNHHWACWYRSLGMMKLTMVAPWATRAPAGPWDPTTVRTVVKPTGFRPWLTFIVGLYQVKPYYRWLAMINSANWKGHVWLNKS